MDLLEDPLDRDDFDPVKYLNENFPTEASLDGLDSFVSKINTRMVTLDEEISATVQNQSAIGGQATKDLAEAKNYLDSLFDKINDIKRKATESEAMVQDLCADIKRLDYAKTHLQTSITSLNRLQMLMNAVEQLEMLSKEGHFRETANLLDAVRQFLGHFEQYRHVSMVSHLVTRIEHIKKVLTWQIRKIFTELAENKGKVADISLAISIPGGLSTVSEACLVVDALGVQVRRELVLEFVQQPLTKYESLFGQGKEHFSVPDVERRWSWFKRLLKEIENDFSSLFPPHWRVELRFLLEFIERTKMHLVQLLTENESKGDASDVHALLKALQSTLKFELEMNDRFQLLKEIRAKEESEAQALKARTLEAEREKDTTLQRLKKDAASSSSLSPSHTEDDYERDFLTLAHATISGGMSSIFDKFLGSYVLLERNNLKDLLAKLNTEEDLAGEESSAQHGNVFTSASSIFVFIKNSIKRCIALTNGQTFFALSQEFRMAMKNYIAMLRARFPAENPMARGELAICHLINTGEYCAEVVPQLEQMVQQKITPNLVNKVSFQDETDASFDLVAFGLKILVGGMMERLDAGFKAMQAMNWGGSEFSGEESAYLHAFQSILLEAIPNIRKTLSSSYFSNFCTKLATEILARFSDSISKLKRVSAEGSQQLLVDAYSLKTLMLQLPNLHAGETSVSTNKSTSPVYVKLITAKTLHIEAMLKLIVTPDDLLLERFSVMWPDGQAVDLQMLMAIKGTKRADQQAILEMFGLKHGNKSNSAALPSSTSSSVGGGAAATAALASATAASAAASAAAFSSMKSLTQDLSSQARSAVGQLKWGGANK